MLSNGSAMAFLLMVGFGMAQMGKAVRGASGFAICSRFLLQWESRFLLSGFTPALAKAVNGGVVSFSKVRSLESEALPLLAGRIINGREGEAVGESQSQS